MSWDQLGWNDQAKKANDFLDNGGFTDVVRNLDQLAQTPLNAECVQSSQCAGGYGCVNGKCVQISGGLTSARSGNGNISGPGFNPDSEANCDPTDPESVCGAATGATTCSKPGCDNDNKIPDPEECCGERCCRASAFGVECFCGPCPGPTGCSEFCTDYSNANPGELAAGCTDGLYGNVCDECQFCDVIHFDGQCQPKTIDLPCWCDEGARCGDCEKCTRDPADTVNYGKCRNAPEDCLSCTTIYNYRCPCNRILQEVTACRNATESGLVGASLARAEAERQCDAICEDEGDPCAGVCTSRSYTGDAPPCPSGYTCTVTGSITAGGVTYTQRTDCNMNDVPPQCKECDCNCHDDCPECTICINGICEEDPLCCSNHRYDYGCGVYVISYTSVTETDAYRSCSDNHITTPANVTNITGNTTINACGMRYEIHPTKLTQSCGALDTSGGVLTKYFITFKQTNPGDAWTETGYRQTYDGHWVNPYDKIDGSKRSTIIITGVTFDGNPVQPSGCY